MSLKIHGKRKREATHKLTSKRAAVSRQSIVDQVKPSAKPRIFQGCIQYEVGNEYFLYNGEYKVYDDPHGFRKAQAHGLGALHGYSVSRDGQLQKQFEYDGQVKHNKYNGFGTLTQFDSEGRVTNVVVGTFRNGHPAGYMNVTHWSGQVYHGGMLGINRHGPGMTVYPPEYKLKQDQGYYFNNWLHGIGKREWKDGNVYKGHFLKGLFNGYGVLTLKRRRIILKGLFKNGKLTKGTMASETKGWTYVGDFKNDQREGLGRLTTRHYTFEGTFLRGLPSVDCKLTTKLFWMQREWTGLKQLFRRWKANVNDKYLRQMFCTSLLSFWSKTQKLH